MMNVANLTLLIVLLVGIVIGHVFGSPNCTRYEEEAIQARRELADLKLRIIERARQAKVNNSGKQ